MKSILHHFYKAFSCQKVVLGLNESVPLNSFCSKEIAFLRNPSYCVVSCQSAKSHVICLKPTVSKGDTILHKTISKELSVLKYRG